MIRVVDIVGISIVAAAFFPVPNAFCQDQVNGLYVTKEDFLTHTLKESEPTDNTHYAFINVKGDLVLNRNGKNKIIHPSEIFGFQNGNSSYRAFVDHKKLTSLTGFYKIERETDVVVYSQPGIQRNGHKTFYYFSRSFDSRIYRLTKRNLKRAYHDSPPPRLPNLIVL